MNAIKFLNKSCQFFFRNIIDNDLLSKVTMKESRRICQRCLILKRVNLNDPSSLSLPTPTPLFLLSPTSSYSPPVPPVPAIWPMTYIAAGRRGGTCQMFVFFCWFPHMTDVAVTCPVLFCWFATHHVALVTCVNLLSSMRSNLSERCDVTGISQLKINDTNSLRC